MKTSELLKQARKFIELGDEKYICNAIDTIREKHPADLDIAFLCRNARDWIHHQLGDHNSYEFWLEANHPEKYQGFWAEYKHARLAWIDWMIAESKKLGD